MVFQDPYASLNPRMTVQAIVSDPLRVHGLYGHDGRQRVKDLLRVVGLNPEHLTRYPHEPPEVSANASASPWPSPWTPTSWCSTNPSPPSTYRGAPVHPGPAVRCAHPDPRAERRRTRIVLEGDVPGPVDPPSGCRFRIRCWTAAKICSEEEPALVDRGQDHPVASHFAAVQPVP